MWMKLCKWECFSHFRGLKLWYLHGFLPSHSAKCCKLQHFVRIGIGQHSLKMGQHSPKLGQHGPKIGRRPSACHVRKFRWHPPLSFPPPTPNGVAGVRSSTIIGGHYSCPSKSFSKVTPFSATWLDVVHMMLWHGPRSMILGTYLTCGAPCAACWANHSRGKSSAFLRFFFRISVHACV